MGIGLAPFVGAILGVGRGCESPFTMMFDASGGMDISAPLKENGELPGMTVIPAMTAAVVPWMVPLIVWVPAVIVKGASRVFGCGESLSRAEPVGRDELRFSGSWPSWVFRLLFWVESSELLLGESVLP